MDRDPIQVVYTPRRQLIFGGLAAMAATIAAGFSSSVVEPTNANARIPASEISSQARCRSDGQRS